MTYAQPDNAALTLVHYELVDIRYSSFYVTGFQLNAPLYGYRFELSRQAPPLPPETGIGSDQWRASMRVPSRLLFCLRSADNERWFCIDTSDHCLNYHVPMLRLVEAYFKVNYDPTCLPSDSPVVPHIGKLYPVAPFFPLRADHRLPLVPPLIPRRSMAWGRRAMLRRLIDAPRVPSLRSLRALREAPKRHDVFFGSVYYEGDHHAEAMESRLRVMEELDRQRLTNAVYGFVSRRDLPAPFRRYPLKRYPLSTYLATLASARVAIYVRGLWDCISFKFDEHLALGLPVSGQTLATDREILAGLPRFDEQFAFDDPRCIAERTAELCRTQELARTLGESNARVFDDVLAPQPATAAVLEKLGLRLERPAAR